MRKSMRVVDVSEIPQAPAFHMNRHGERTDLPRTHPRFSFSLHTEIKRELSIPERIELCEALAPYVSDALSRWADDPIEVEVLGMTVRLCEHHHPSKAGKVQVFF